MSKGNMRETIEKMTAPGKGILAADESTGTIAKRFQGIGLESTEDKRLEYRELLFTAEGVDDCFHGVILFEETLFQKTKSGKRLTEILEERGIVPGIKVDKGLKPLPNSPSEKITEGMDGLSDRLALYRENGARFAKWRAVYSIGKEQPTPLAIYANAECLARYAAICQEEGIVPIVEPEVLMDGNHDLETSEQVHRKVFNEVFNALNRYQVDLECMILKPSMVIDGSARTDRSSVEDVAAATVRVLRETVPAAVPTINFLSGGQSDTDATAHLDAMNKLDCSKPWILSFSYGRALQAAALETWGGKPENREQAQRALKKRARLNSAAVRGEYSADMETNESAFSVK